ncbi:hypothetical protein E8E14_013782 [Neopestalotiopsis sp. 37M]|nr:hypothetical protein E8E14_013782 [Neopestalotiopsis sp. 37M]
MAVRSLFCFMAQFIIHIFAVLVPAVDVAINSYAYWSMKNVIQPFLPTLTIGDPAEQFRRSSRILIFFFATALLAGVLLLWIIYLRLCKLFQLNTSHITGQEQGDVSKQCCKVTALATTIALHVVLGALSLNYISGWEQGFNIQDERKNLRSTFRCLVAIIEFDLVMSSIQIVVLGLLAAFILCAQVVKHQVHGAARARARAHAQSEHQDFEL